ncbi:hypothetical protein AAIR98_001335 [Elusimicrobium simillimum]|uniref:hypothetical protein n=1 Tax=Elusimicrobium simillimum TaxID=3143438 RepID=UPI003C7007B9
MILQLRKCDIGFTHNSQAYDFTDQVESVTIEDSEAKHLTRGASARNTKGIVYTEGSKSPKVVTIVLVNMAPEYASLFKTIREEEDRLEIYCIDRKTGAKRMFKDCILQKAPTQLNMAEGAEELNISLVFETFKIEEAA